MDLFVKSCITKIRKRGQRGLIWVHDIKDMSEANRYTRSHSSDKHSEIRLLMAEWLAHRTHIHEIVGCIPAYGRWRIKKPPAWATGDDNGSTVLLAVNEYLAIDKDASCT